MSKHKKSNRKISFRSMLLLSYFLIVLIPLMLSGLRTYLISEKALVDMARDNVFQLVSSKNRILDMTFSGVREASLNLLVDKQLYSVFDKLDNTDEIAVIESSKTIKDLLRKYFYSYPDVVSAVLITDFYTFGYQDYQIPIDNSFFDSDIYKMIEEKKGGSIFIPTYNAYKLHGKKNMLDSDFEKDFVFSLSRVTNITLVIEESTSIAFKKFSPNPVLLLNFSEKTFRKELQQLTFVNGSEYIVVSEDGTIISHSNKELLGIKMEDEWLKPILLTESGVNYSEINGQNMIVCYDTSAITNWTTIVTIPRPGLLSTVLKDIRRDLTVFSVIYFSLAIFISFLLTNKITGSLDYFLKAINKMEQGNFGVKAEFTNIAEVDHLIGHFNKMSKQIKALIDENYLVKIRQKESEIAILTTQLNPHFLYNTLNIIQLSNLNGEYEKTGKMIVTLSRMLNYIAENTQEMKPLSEDFSWLKKYIYIMECRYQNDFRVEFVLDEAMNDYYVPKLFLQPLVENSILHAFNEPHPNGIIRITSELIDSHMVFTVEDNGGGMTEEQIAHFFEESNVGIGIKNVYLRLKLIYGERCRFTIDSKLGCGTKTIIRIALP